MNSAVSIDEKEDSIIVKTIHRFALTTSVFSFISGSAYFALGYLFPCIIVTIIGLLFLLIAYLNKKSKPLLARVLAIITTNLGVLFFSPYIGFEAGIYLYLFTAPLLVYLLFKTKQKRQIYFCIFINLTTCFSIYLIDKYQVIESVGLKSNDIQLIFNVNFIFSFLFSIVLVSIFAKNNETYVDMLVDINQTLTNQQEILKVEIEEKNRINVELEKSVNEKITLLAEVHHRVKNNLAVVSGLLELENLFVKEKNVSEVLKNSKNRIKSIALLHEKLYEDKNFEKIDYQTYIKDLVRFIQLSFSQESKNITIELNVNHFLFSMEIAQPLSLLINELITNSYKHAFKNVENSTISIILAKKNDEIVFIYRDNGVGFDILKQDENDSIGMNLIHSFIDQLDGKLEDNTKLGEGCKLIISFKEI
jgi:two-component sensor histidine kinase